MRINPKSKILLQRLGFSLAFALIACGGAVLSVATLGRTAYRWHGLVVELRLLPTREGADDSGSDAAGGSSGAERTTRPSR